MPREQKFIAAIPSSKLSTLVEGCNCVVVNKIALVVNIHSGGIHVYKNRCAHQGGKFVPDLEDADTAVCSRHGWKFNSRTGHYTNPPANGENPCFIQEELYTTLSSSGDLEVYEVVVDVAKSSDVVQFAEGKLKTRSPKSSLVAGEFTVTYYGHACVIIKAGSFKIATDPWLVGDAFLGGWYPLHEPPKNWHKDLAEVDMIYISHRHPDHYSPQTLRVIAKQNPSIPIIVGDLRGGSVLDSYLPMTKVHRLELGRWKEFSNEMRLAILPDGALGDLDTSLLLEYKGYSLFNYVDCGDPNNGQLGKVDIVLGDFAGGASGYPMCMKMEKYSDKYIVKKKQQMNATYLAKTMNLLEKLRPDIFIPFAGYFSEARPSDTRIRRLNTKNSAIDVARKVEDTFHGSIGVFVPTPGRLLDMKKPDLTMPVTRKGHFASHPASKVRLMLRPYEETAVKFAPFVMRRREALEYYFTWANFQDYDLVLEIIECDENLSPCEEPFFVDFRRGLRFPQDLAYARVWERIFVRKSAFRHAMRHGMGWDSFFIGFSTRIEREPDVYHLAFWNHMSNLLPRTPPNFQERLGLPSLTVQDRQPVREMAIIICLVLLLFVCAFYLMRVDSLPFAEL